LIAGKRAAHHPDWQQRFASSPHPCQQGPRRSSRCSTSSRPAPAKPPMPRASRRWRRCAAAAKQCWACASSGCAAWRRPVTRGRGPVARGS
jgi:hypothetical protein